MQIFCNMAGLPAKQGVSYTSKEKGEYYGLYL